LSSIAGKLLVDLTLQFVVPHLLREAAKLATRPAIDERSRFPVCGRATPPRRRGAPSLASKAGLAVMSLPPGRIRVRVDGLRGNAALADVAAPLQALPGVRLARANQLTGTVLVEYDPTAIEVGDILAKLERSAVLPPVGTQGFPKVAGVMS
jgi:hypothetical protein